MKRCWPSLFFLLIFTQSFAQDWNYYTPIKAEGDVPAEITDAYIDKYQQQAEEIDGESRKDRRLKDNFFRQSEYFIDELMVSGRVFFGDSITNYCQMVLDKLIGDDEELRHKIKLFTIKSGSVNAFATQKGLIFVNLGLLAQLENEAQLAYILAHELVHYTNNHTLDQYIESDRIRRGEDMYRQTSNEEKIGALSSYSKSQELEADDYGYKNFYASTGYSRSAPFQVMDILQYGYLPFDEVEFERTFFEDEDLQFPDALFTDELNPITAEADYDDEHSSHPNIMKRKRALEFVVDSANMGEKFLISEDSFYHVRKLARYELCRLGLNERDYGQAIYHAYLLLLEDPENRYLRLTIGKALHAMSVYHNNRLLSDVLRDPEDVEGESHQVYHFFDALGRDEMAVLAVSYIYKLKKDFPEDKAIDKLYESAFRELVFENKLTPDDFKNRPDEKAFSLNSLEKSPEATTKLERIRSKRMVRDTAYNEEEFHLYAFASFMEDEVFITRFDSLVAEEEKYGRYYESRSKGDYDKYDKNQALGIDRLVCVTPKYLKLDQRDENGIKFLTTNEQLEVYKENLNDLSEKVDLELLMLDYKGDNDFNIDKYNDLSLLKTWIHERLNHENNNVLMSDYDYMEGVINRYGTPYISATGNLTLRIKENTGAQLLGLLLSSVTLPVYTPFILVDMVSPEFQSFNYFFVFNLENGDALLAEYNYYNTTDRKDYLRSIIYNNLLQVADKPDSK